MLHWLAKGTRRAGASRSEPPTAKRKQDARKRGQVVRSRELTGALGLLAIVVLVGCRGDRVGPWRSLLEQMLDDGLRGNQEIVNSVMPVIGGFMRVADAAACAYVGRRVGFERRAGRDRVFRRAISAETGPAEPVANIGNLFSSAG